MTAISCLSPTAPPTQVPTVAPTTIPSVAPIASSSPTPNAPAVGSGRVEVLNAANAAFQAGDVATASTLYARVLNTPPTGEPPTATMAINDLARFRGMVSLLADGREDDAHLQLTELQQSDPDGPLTRLATQLWDQYGMVGALRGACAQLQPQIASQAGATLSTLAALGVTVDPQTLCSVPAR